MNSRSLVGIFAALLTALFLLGCSQPVEKPQIKEIKNILGNITDSETEILTNVRVYNPNPFPLPLKDVQTGIYMNELKLGEGSALKAEVPASSESNIVISTKIDNSKIPEWWVSHLKNGERTEILMRGYLVLDLKVMEFRYPVEFSASLKTDILSGMGRKERMDGIEVEANSSWGAINEEHTEIITLAKVKNQNPYPVMLPKFRYKLEMNGIEMARGESEVDAVVKPMSEATIPLRTVIENSKIKDWWVSHLKNGEKTKLKMQIIATFEVPGKQVDITVVEDEEWITTEIFS
jgi:LEA14-like dessication related protein